MRVRLVVNDVVDDVVNDVVDDVVDDVADKKFWRWTGSASAQNDKLKTTVFTHRPQPHKTCFPAH